MAPSDFRNDICAARASSGASGGVAADDSAAPSGLNNSSKSNATRGSSRIRGGCVAVHPYCPALEHGDMDLCIHRLESHLLTSDETRDQRLGRNSGTPVTRDETREERRDQLSGWLLDEWRDKKSMNGDWDWRSRCD